MSKQTTIEKYGDDYVTDGLITRIWPADFDGIFYDDKVYQVGPYGLALQAGITEVDLPSCKSVEADGFYGCTGLTKVSMASCTLLDSSAFDSVATLTEIDFPVLTRINQRGFYGAGLTTISLPELDYIENYVFTGCKSLVSADLPKLKVINTEGFANCTKLREINLPSCKLLFRDCLKYTQIERLDLPAIETLGVSSLQYCTKLAEVNLGPSITHIYSGAFNNTKAGIVINLPVAEGVIEGAPWGATDAVINYDHPYLSQYET